VFENGKFTAQFFGAAALQPVWRFCLDCQFCFLSCLREDGEKGYMFKAWLRIEVNFGLIA
jgi:hypothetical protein